eukprot:TRINITY_DN9722_c0_g1_i1.p1 TRINITY_DN9722_c0_g1~~TRINITY_DN9722_c0_g1_i1.p1  ORF type:complete len:188 (+),score=48.47 TRINITY_DN9722_c0_g1_i1:192-755(+)
MVLTKDGATLRRAFTRDDDEAAYLDDVTSNELTEWSGENYSLELTRSPSRALRVWMPIQLVGVAAVRQLLQDKLQRTAHVLEHLQASERFRVVVDDPDLSIVVLRAVDLACDTTERGNELTKAVLEAVKNDGRAMMSGTEVLVGGEMQLVIRFVVLGASSELEHVNLGLQVLEELSLIHISEPTRPY